MISFPGSAWKRSASEALPRHPMASTLHIAYDRTAEPCMRGVPRQSLGTRAWRWFFAVALALMICGNASAQTNLFPEPSASAPIRALPASARLGFSPQTPHPAVVRVISPERNSASLGSGTLVDVSEKHGLVITNWHVVKDAAGNVIVSFPDGFQSPGYVIKMDRDWDLAAVAIWRPRVQPVPIAAEVPRRGDPLTIAGYGGGNYRTQSGRCTQYLSPGAGLPYDIVEVSAAARHGDSGGPIFNTRGELAGVLFGEGDGMTSGSASARVGWFLASIGVGKPAPLPPTEFAAAPVQGTHGQEQGAANVGRGTVVESNRAGGDYIVAVPAPRNGFQVATHPEWHSPASTTAVVDGSPTSLPPPNYPRTSAPPLNRQFPPATSGPPPADPFAQPQPPFAAVTAAPNADPQSSTQQLSWEDLAGHTAGQQIKTILAALGVLMLLYHLSRRIA